MNLQVALFQMHWLTTDHKGQPYDEMIEKHHLKRLQFYFQIGINNFQNRAMHV